MFIHISLKYNIDVQYQVVILHVFLFCFLNNKLCTNVYGSNTSALVTKLTFMNSKDSKKWLRLKLVFFLSNYIPCRWIFPYYYHGKLLSMSPGSMMLCWKTCRLTMEVYNAGWTTWFRNSVILPIVVRYLYVFVYCNSIPDDQITSVVNTYHDKDYFTYIDEYNANFHRNWIAWEILLWHGSQHKVMTLTR